ncbi:MAG: cob(I)yrinic acid a c-diamide adenosyltransferase [Hyphomonas sp. 32-62-5]|nr:MAG: cob(I)yrinic acid a c-diamide adenosyltransferase [Hyphomonas sp. 32-62-5]
MVRLDKIYTRTGDKGETRLSTGEPVAKWHPRVAAYGTVDELNAALGVAALEASGEMLERLRRIQNDLFDLGADAMNASIPPLDSFILPGGSCLAAQMHVARTLCRRAERAIAELASLENEPVNPEALAFINRLSDWLFVAGRAANNDGADDVKWVPGANR